MTGTQIVPQDAAAWMDVDPAVILPSTDHHTICRFFTQQNEAFIIIRRELIKMSTELLRRGEPAALTTTQSFDGHGDNIRGLRKARTDPVARSSRTTEVRINLFMAPDVFENVRQTVSVNKHIKPQIFSVTDKGSTTLSLRQSEKGRTTLPGGFVARKKLGGQFVSFMLAGPTFVNTKHWSLPTMAA